MESALDALQEAILRRDRKSADTYAKELEELTAPTAVLLDAFPNKISKAPPVGFSSHQDPDGDLLYKRIIPS